MSTRNKGQELWKKAIKIIPGGNGLLSKRPDRYAKDIWPNYFSKAKGCMIWDLEGNSYIDMTQNGIGTTLFGYSDDEINAAVFNAVSSGVNTTLNAPEEVELAQEILKLNPDMSSVKFARGGGEAMSIAVRIARAHSNRQKIAFSGYHGWHDWYLAANLSSGENLDGHLLPGLVPSGVPEGLTGTSVPFKYNDVDDFMKTISCHSDIGIIVIEGARYSLPSSEFLNAITQVAKEKNLVVIMDEITSGFRNCTSGVYCTMKFSPDIVVYGKALGNGFAISAVVGKHHFMTAAEDTFISSTMWTERVGFAAGLATLKKIQRDQVYKHLIRIGEMIGAGWLSLARKHELNLSITDFAPLIGFRWEYGDENNALTTLFTQLMLRRGYLAAADVYVTSAHTDIIVKEYLENVDDAFSVIKSALVDGKLYDLLDTEVRSDSFKRLN